MLNILSKLVAGWSSYTWTGNYTRRNDLFSVLEQLWLSLAIPNNYKKITINGYLLCYFIV